MSYTPIHFTTTYRKFLETGAFDPDCGISYFHTREIPEPDPNESDKDYEERNRGYGIKTKFPSRVMSLETLAGMQNNTKETGVDAYRQAIDEKKPETYCKRLKRSIDFCVITGLFPEGRRYDPKTQKGGLVSPHTGYYCLDLDEIAERNPTPLEIDALYSKFMADRHIHLVYKSASRKLRGIVRVDNPPTESIVENHHKMGQYLRRMKGNQYKVTFDSCFDKVSLPNFMGSTPYLQPNPLNIRLDWDIVSQEKVTRSGSVPTDVYFPLQERRLTNDRTAKRWENYQHLTSWPAILLAFDKIVQSDTDLFKRISELTRASWILVRGYKDSNNRFSKCPFEYALPQLDIYAERMTWFAEQLEERLMKNIKTDSFAANEYSGWIQKAINYQDEKDQERWLDIGNRVDVTLDGFSYIQA